MIACAIAVESARHIDEIRRQKMLAAVLIIGGVSIGTALGILAVLHLLRYLPAATGILLGLHFWPLATALRQQVFRIFACLLVAWSAACLLLETRVGLFSAIGIVILLCALAVTLKTRKRKPAILRAFEDDDAPILRAEAADTSLQGKP